MNTTAAETRGSLNTGSITRSLSTGSYDNGDNSATAKQRKVPIYLRASPGSCHDVCKYGKGHHAFEDKPKIPLRKRIAKPSLNEDTFIQILVSGDKQNKENVDAKKNSLNAKPSPRKPNARSDKPPEIIKREITLSQDSIIDDKISSSDQKTNPSSVKSKPVKAKPSDGGKMRASASAKKSPLVPKSSLSKTASNKATQLGRVKSSAPPQKDQHTSNTQVSEKIIHVIEIETGKNPLESAPEKVSLSQENPSEEVDFADNKTLVMETDNTILESFPSSLKSSPSQRRPPSSLSSSSTKSSFHRRSPSSPSSLSKSSFHRRSPSSSSSKSSPSHRRSPSLLSSSSKSTPSHRRSPSSLLSSSKSTPSHRRSPSSSSSKSSSSHSRSPSMTSVEVEEETKHISKETNKPVSGKRTPSNVRKICNDKYEKPVKLKFRSGKVLDPHQDNNNNYNNNNIARRLKFRRMRADGDKAEISVISHIQENSKTFLRKSRVVVSEFKRRSPTRLFGGDNNIVPVRLRFRRGRIIGGDEGKGDSKRNYIRNGGGYEGANMKMKLKHQLSDLKVKKDGQCLFNNVIEETVTKLAVSKKNKVLALVGAFETVISLHSPRAY